MEMMDSFYAGFVVGAACVLLRVPDPMNLAAFMQSVEFEAEAYFKMRSPKDAASDLLAQICAMTGDTPESIRERIEQKQKEKAQ